MSMTMTHSACSQRLKEMGGKAQCCYCVPHDGCEITEATKLRIVRRLQANTQTSKRASQMTAPQAPNINEYLIARCKTKDTHDFPNLEDESRCPNCKLWEEVDAYVTTKCNEMLDEIFQGRESIFVEKDSHNTRVLYRHNFEDESKK